MQLEEGKIVTGKVTGITKFGAFVELENGVDALLHVSQISKEHIEKPADVLKVGEEVTAKVVDFNEEDKKISLSIKAMLEPEKTEEAETEALTILIEENVNIESLTLSNITQKFLNSKEMPVMENRGEIKKLVDCM